MRILVVSQYFWPESFRVNDLVAELVERGHAVTVLTGWPNYPDGVVLPEFRKDPESFSHYAGARIVRIPLAPRGNGKVRLAVNYASFIVSGLSLGVWRLRGQAFDCIFVFASSPITSALPALLLRRLKRAPLLLWVLDLWPETLSAVGAIRSRRVLAWVGRAVTFIYRRSDRILVQSRAFLPNIEQYAGDTARVRYFPAWVEPIFRDAAQDVAPAPEAAPYRETFNVMFAGNIGEAQDFPAILDAAEALRDCADLRWLIVGDGRAADAVRIEISRRGLQDRVIMLGRFPLERMPSFFRAADALLVTLKADPIFAMTIPGKVQSYLAAGLPILGMLDGEGARVIAEAGAGLTCCAGRGGDLAERVRALMAMPAAERVAMGERGRAYCTRNFDRATLMSELEGWMRELTRTGR